MRDLVGSLVRLVVAAALLLSLNGCALILPILAGLASGSTLLKNEANCSLVDLASCSMPHLTAPEILTRALVVPE